MPLETISLVPAVPKSSPAKSKAAADREAKLEHLREVRARVMAEMTEAAAQAKREVGAQARATILAVLEQTPATVAELSEHLGISMSTLWYWIEHDEELKAAHRDAVTRRPQREDEIIAAIAAGTWPLMVSNEQLRMLELRYRSRNAQRVEHGGKIEQHIKIGVISADADLTPKMISDGTEAAELP